LSFSLGSNIPIHPFSTEYLRALIARSLPIDASFFSITRCEVGVDSLRFSRRMANQSAHADSNSGDASSGGMSGGFDFSRARFGISPERVKPDSESELEL